MDDSRVRSRDSPLGGSLGCKNGRRDAPDHTEWGVPLEQSGAASNLAALDSSNRGATLEPPKNTLLLVKPDDLDTSGIADGFKFGTPVAITPNHFMNRVIKPIRLSGIEDSEGDPVPPHPVLLGANQRLSPTGSDHHSCHSVIPPRGLRQPEPNRIPVTAAQSTLTSRRNALADAPIPRPSSPARIPLVDITNAVPKAAAIKAPPQKEASSLEIHQLSPQNLENRSPPNASSSGKREDVPLPTAGPWGQHESARAATESKKIRGSKADSDPSISRPLANERGIQQPHIFPQGSEHHAVGHAPRQPTNRPTPVSDLQFTVQSRPGSSGSSRLKDQPSRHRESTTKGDTRKTRRPGKTPRRVEALSRSSNISKRRSAATEAPPAPPAPATAAASEPQADKEDLTYRQEGRQMLFEGVAWMNKYALEIRKLEAQIKAHEADVRQRQHERSELLDHITNRNHKVQKLEHKLELKDQEALALSQLIKTRSEEVERLVEEQRLLEGRLKSMDENQSQLISKHMELIDSLKKNSSDLKDENSRLEQQLRSKEDEMRLSSTRYQKIEAKFHGLREHLNRAIEEQQTLYHRSREHCADAIQEVQAMDHTFAVSMKQDIAAARGRVEHIRRALAQARTEHANLEEQNRSLSQRLDQRDSQVSQLEATAEKLSTDLEEKKAENRDLISRIGESSTHNEGLRQQSEVTQAKLDALIKHLEAAQPEARSEIQDLQKCLESTRSEIHAISEAQAGGEAQTLKVSGSLEQLCQRLDEQRVIFHQQLDESRNENSVLSTLVEEKDNECQAMENELQEMRAFAQDKEEQNAELRDRLDQTMTLMAQKEKEEAEKAENRDAVDAASQQACLAMEKECTDAKAKLLEAEKQQQAIAEELEASRNVLASKEQDEHHLTEKMNALQASLTEAEEKVSRANQEALLQKAQVEELQIQVSTVKDLQASLAESEQKNSDHGSYLGVVFSSLEIWAKKSGVPVQSLPSRPGQGGKWISGMGKRHGEHSSKPSVLPAANGGASRRIRGTLLSKARAQIEEGPAFVTVDQEKVQRREGGYSKSIMKATTTTSVVSSSQESERAAAIPQFGLFTRSSYNRAVAGSAPDLQTPRGKHPLESLGDKLLNAKAARNTDEAAEVPGPKKRRLDGSKSRRGKPPSDLTFPTEGQTTGQPALGTQGQQAPSHRFTTRSLNKAAASPRMQTRGQASQQNKNGVGKADLIFPNLGANTSE